MFNKKTLHLVLTYKWFDKIKSGEKTTEYREMNPYWNKIFSPIPNTKYDKVRFQRGYTKNPEKMIFEIKDICPCINVKNDLNKPAVWAIELGKKIEERS